MGLFDKIKNLFYDEEEIDVPIEQPKEEITIKSGNVAVIEKQPDDIKYEINNNAQMEIIETPKIDEINKVVSERDLMTENQNFKFPIIFEDEDIAKIEKTEKVKEEPKVQKNKYQKPVLDRKVIDEVVKKPKKFQPTPIISPIYGILDKNYERSSNKNYNNNIAKENDMELNFDTIRQKAYGTLSDDIEAELSKNENKIDEIENRIDNILEENNLLSELQDNNTEKINEDNLYSYEDFGVEYKIDDSKLSNNVDNEINNKRNKEIELTEDLFNLIDSMYDK